MVFYFIILFLILLFSIIGYYNPKLKAVLSYSVILMISLISSIRDGIGTDFENYIFIYNDVPTLDLVFSKPFMIEPLFWLLCSVIKTFGGSSAILFFATSFITNMVIYQVTKKLMPKYFLIVFAIFYCFFLLRFEFNTIRHGMMIAWVWLAFSFIQSRNLKKFIIFILIGGCFHIVGFLFLPFYWLLNLKLKKWLYIILLFGSVGIGFYTDFLKILMNVLPGGNILHKKLLFYTEVYYGNESAALGLTLGMVVYSIFWLFLLFKIEIFERKGSNNLMLFNSLFFALFFAYLFNQYGVFVERITSTFYVSLIFIIPSFLYFYPIKFLSRIILSVFFFCYMLLLLNKNLASKEKNGEFQYIPFKTIL